MSVLKEVKNLDEKRNQVTKERNEAEKASELAAEVEENYKGRHVKKSHKVRNTFLFVFAGLGALVASVALNKDNNKSEILKEAAPTVIPASKDKTNEDKTNIEEKTEEKKENVVTKGKDRSNTITHDKNGYAEADLEDKKTYGGKKEPDMGEPKAEVETKGNETVEVGPKEEDKLEEAYKDIEFNGAEQEKEEEKNKEQQDKQQEKEEEKNKEQQEKEQQEKEEEKVPSKEEQENQEKSDNNIQKEEKAPQQTHKGTVVEDPEWPAEFER